MELRSYHPLEISHQNQASKMKSPKIVVSNASSPRNARMGTKGSSSPVAVGDYNTTSTSQKALVLRNLGQTDVVFGTKGNGRNEVFLQLLEEHAGLYVKSSKFEKMALIQRLIRDWKGNFFFLNPKTNELSLAREKSNSSDSDSSSADSDEEASLPSTSSKLYTSVRRMMNYVVAKNNYSYVQQPSAASASPKRTSTKTKKRKDISSLDDAPALKKSKKNKTKAASTTVAAAAAPMTTTSPFVTRSDAVVSPVPLMGSSKRVPMLVTPEPSPRTLQDKLQQTHQKARAFPENGTLHFPTTFVSSPAAPPSSHGCNGNGNGASTRKLIRPASTKMTVDSSFLMTPKRLIDTKTIGRLEDTAIYTLVSLSSASWSEDGSGEQGSDSLGLYF